MTTLGRWRTTIVTALATAAVLVGAGLLVTSGHDEPVARPGTDTTPAPVPRASSSAATPTEELGPEGVPLLAGRPLGPARSPAPGKSSGGIPCGAREQLDYHVHARLSLFIDGKPRSVPLGIGIAPPVKKSETPNGEFAAGGACFSWLHTHAADGIIHIEAPRRITFLLGQFFDVWRQRLDRRHLGDNAGRVVAYVNGKRFRGDPRAIKLVRHAQIQLEIGQPVVAPESVDFPTGL
jgi:hypothetical protein